MGISTDLYFQRKFLMVEINDYPIILQVDTALDITVISIDVYEILGRPSAMECFELDIWATVDILSLKWQFDCKICFHGTAIETYGTCYVTNIPNLNLIVLEWLELFGIFDIPLNTVCYAVPNTIDQQSQHVPHCRTLWMNWKDFLNKVFCIKFPVRKGFLQSSILWSSMDQFACVHRKHVIIRFQNLIQYSLHYTVVNISRKSISKTPILTFWSARNQRNI